MPGALRGNKKFGNKQQVADRYGVVTIWVDRKVEEDPTFPKPVYFNGVKKPYWVWAELDVWDAAAIAARDNAAA